MHRVSDDSRPSVVLVDDSREVRAVVGRLLASSGFEVVGEGGDGDEAIVLAFRHEPELLLLDTSMPHVDGIEALPAILAISPETQVVMFTGFEEPGLAARARELGAADLIEKSVPMEELPERLLQVVRAGREASAHSGDPVRAQPGPQLYAVPSSPSLPSGPEEQAVLNEHIQQFRELFDRAEIGMATLTSSGTIVRANRALATLMSCTPYDLVGVDYGRLTVGRGDELDQRLEDICALGEDLTSFEHELPAAPGAESTRVVRATLAPIRDSRQQVLYVFAQVQDVTAQREIESDLRRSEENFRRLVTVVEEYAIFLLDTNGIVISWNSGAQRIKGYTASEVVGRHFQIFYPAQERAEGRPERNLELALRDGGHVDEGWRVRKDGSRFWAMAVITPVYDDAGRHVAFAKVTRDQTQQREREEERRSFIDQLNHLLSVTAHELRTPTAVIDGASGLLQSSWDELSPDSRDEVLRAIRGSADRLRRLALDMSAASRSDSEALPLAMDDVSLTDLVEGAALRAQAAEVGVQITTEVPHEGVFRGDAGRLAQALDNLLDNAVHHGRPPITLAGTTDDHVCVRVTDAGPGVDPDVEARLFERFATGPNGGTGLGLYLVREITRRHGGDVAYHPPTDGTPTAFEITLPTDPVMDGPQRHST
jgi:PAS domain S-box-containing protein